VLRKRFFGDDLVEHPAKVLGKSTDLLERGVLLGPSRLLLILVSTPEIVLCAHVERNHQGKGNVLLFPRDPDIRHMKFLTIRGRYCRKGLDSIIVSLDDCRRQALGSGVEVDATTVAYTTKRSRPFHWPPEDSERERLEVLHDGGEMELVTSAGKTPKPHPLEAVISLQMREPHFDPLSLVSRSGERLCLHLSPWCRLPTCPPR
jgi:hypothetical protein